MASRVSALEVLPSQVVWVPGRLRKCGKSRSRRAGEQQSSMTHEPCAPVKEMQCLLHTLTSILLAYDDEGEDNNL